jgi:hypothetical protein
MTQANELAAAVTQYIKSDVPDALEKAHPFLNYLVSSEGKEYQDGGTLIQFPIKTIKNASSGFISGTSAIVDATPSIQLQYGVLNWKFYNFNTNFTLKDYTIANGKQDKAGFFEKKTKGALADSMREIAEAMHGTSTTNALAPEGLKDIAAASGTAYAGLLDTDYTTGAYLPYISTATTVNYQTVNDMIVKLRARMQTEGLTGSKMMGLCNESVYGRFLNSVQAQQRFGTDEAMAKAGFENFIVNGVNIFLDAFAPGSQDGTTGDNYLYIFPKEIMQLMYVFGFGKESPFDGTVQLPLQPLKSIQHYMAFNLVCNNRRLLAVNKTLVA